MANIVNQSQTGFTPKSEVKTFTDFSVASNFSGKHYKYAPVKLSGGYLVPCVAQDIPLGIICAQVLSAPGYVKKVPVITDTDVVYEVASDSAPDITDVGKYVELLAVTGSDTTGRSTATVKTSTASATPTATTAFVVVGLPKTVADTSDINSVLVKLVESKPLDVPVDATV